VINRTIAYSPLSRPHDFHAQFLRDSNNARLIEKVVAVTTSSGLVLSINNFRKRALFINTGTAAIVLSKSPAALTTQGIYLYPLGGSWLEQSDALGYLWVGLFSAISVSGTNNLFIVEE